MLVLAGLSALVLLFNGPSGIVVASVATLVGCLPPDWRQEGHLTGCLLLPYCYSTSAWRGWPSACCGEPFP